MIDRLPAAYLPAIFMFVAVGLAVLSLALFWEWWSDRKQRREVTRRLEGMASGEGGTDPFNELFRDTKLSEVTWMEPLMARLPHSRDLQHLLEQADVTWRVGTFFLLTVGASLAMGLSAFVVARLLIVAVAASAFGATLPYIYVKRRKAKRLAAFEEHFPESIDLLGRAIRAGHAFSTGLQMVADESPEPLAGEFLRVFEEQKFGLAIEDSLLALADRIDLVDMRILVTALLIQREVGGNLAEILDKISYTIRERFTIQRQVRVYTAQGRFTGYLLAVLPIGVGFLIFMMNQEYMMILIREPTGRLMMTVAGLLQVMGFFVIRKIIHIEV
ncbi:MAG TPA: type II secretion system F family protein [Gemmatimonadota bacterium]|nr:type II secretion system F family protein [Gemmatimonadota bacterium]